MTKEQPKFIGEKAFIAKPAEIAFRDFIVGKPHQLIVRFTNVSLAQNSLKVLPLPEKIRVKLDLSRIILKWNTLPRVK